MNSPYLTQTKQTQLIAFMKRMGVEEGDLVEKFVLGSGRGGQKVNKTSSCVYLKHQPSGIEIKCQGSRSRELNRYHARKGLCERLEEMRLGAKSKRQQDAERIRRQKRRRSRRQKERMLEKKREQGQKKRLRAPVSIHD